LFVTGTLVVVTASAGAAGTVTQDPPTTNNTTVDASSTFTDQLNATGDGSEVTYAVVTDTGILVSPTGAVTTTGLLAVGTYSASGTDSDVTGDAGTWSYSLDVAASTIAQVSPTTGTTTVSGSLAFSDQLNVSGNNGAVTYATTATSPALTVNPSTGVVTTTGQLSPGSYSVSGTDSDADGNAGVWAYSLMVASPALSPGGHALVQTSATTGSTSSSASATFAPPAVTVGGSTGTVTFTTTTASAGLKVTSGGVITVTASLAPGSYTVSGTDLDSSSDTGVWTYTLRVSHPVETVTFLANGGKGSMGAQTDDQAAPLTSNEFIRKGYTFVDWNTAADGTGTSYANRETYAFTEPLALYARWKRGKVAFHRVTFFAHGGKGSMAVQRENAATGLSKVKFTRKGYAFANWNTKANGKGVSFANQVTYSFKRNLSLYARWKKDKRPPTKPEFTVTFDANGGLGVMASEKGRAPAALSQVTFTRKGYTFASWNTKAGGSGANYANRAEYPFGSSVNLFAQWVKVKKTVAPPPIVYGGMTLGPFARGSSTLTPGLKSQISDIAGDVRSQHKFQIALLGFGDTLPGTGTSSSKNVALGRARARAVASYLQGRLSALSLKGGWSISIGAVGTGKTNSGQIESALVSVTLS
jgi:uncharacterized repeat protein (TIGR02543 family)